ncbi:MAG: VOC family protein [Sphingomonadaceae bacterium]|nr:VOC family protein [Sphingomonadaceae bacterium]
MAREILGYGQPLGGVVQTAFVVEDIHASIRHYQADCAAGPFFLLDHFLQPGQTYRGTESTADVTIAMGYVGHMLVELIQPLDQNPSVYKEVIEQRGYGFHHWGIGVHDTDAALVDYQARGYAEAFRAAVPTGGEVIYLDQGDAARAGFLELIPVNDAMDAHFTSFYTASLDWDGSDPVRPFI